MVNQIVNKRMVLNWDRKIKERQDAVAKERDKLDAVIGELEDLRECCDRAYSDLQSARDALSELV
jgi:hypothetical protein